MINILKIGIKIINKLHDFLTTFFDSFGVVFSDKQLHFIVIGVLGMAIYLVVDMVFKALSKYSISILSFIYTSTVLMVIVFGIEIEQKITGSGHMEFADIVAGLWGFITFFVAYVTICIIIFFIKMAIKKILGKNIEKCI